MNLRPCEPSRSASWSAKLSPTQLKSFRPEVFSNGRIITTSLTPCGAADAVAWRGGVAAKTKRSAGRVAAKRLSIRTSLCENRERPRRLSKKPGVGGLSNYSPEGAFCGDARQQSVGGSKLLASHAGFKPVSQP